MAEEWCVWDEATGEWWGVLPGKDRSGWGAPEPARYKSHTAIVAVGAFDEYRAKAAIIRAPPREMTDDEAMAWLRNHTELCLRAFVEKSVATWGVYVLSSNLSKGILGEMIGSSHESHYDAIRAARKTLEK